MLPWPIVCFPRSSAGWLFVPYNAESIKQYIARAKPLTLNVKYHGIEVPEQEISRRVLNGLPPAYAPEKRNFALKTDFSLSDLEGTTSLQVIEGFACTSVFSKAPIDGLDLVTETSKLL